MHPSAAVVTAAQHTDTTPAAAEAQLKALRALGPAARLELAVEMSTAVRGLLRARLETDHPDWTAAQLDREVLRHTLPGGVLPAALR